jgi:hypothetical protein
MNFKAYLYLFDQCFEHKFTSLVNFLHAQRLAQCKIMNRTKRTPSMATPIALTVLSMVLYISLILLGFASRWAALLLSVLKFVPLCMIAVWLFCQVSAL